MVNNDNEQNMVGMRENLFFTEPRMAEIIRKDKAVKKTNKGGHDSIQKQEKRAPEAGRRLDKYD